MKPLRVLTNSERSAFACEKRWAFGYVDGLTAYDSAAPLRLGSLVHTALAAWYRELGDLSIGDLREVVIAPWLEKREEWLGRLEPTLGEEGAAWVALRFDEDVELAKLSEAMLAGYLRERATDFERWRIVAVEGQAARWVKGPTGGPLRDFFFRFKGKKHRRRWAYAGAIDLVVEDLEVGGLWEVEHKTTKSVDLVQFSRKLVLDPQTRGYVWILGDPIPEFSSPELLDLGGPIRGVILNSLRKKVPTVPALLKKTGKTSKDKRIDTTRDVFLATLLERGEEPDDYADLLESLRGRSFYHRERFPFTEREIADFELDLGQAADRMKHAEAQDFHPRQTEACQGPGRYRCEFHDLCLEDGDYARSDFSIKTIRHAELLDDLAEPWMGVARGADEPPKKSGADELAESFREQATQKGTDPFGSLLDTERGDAEDAVDPFEGL